MENEMYRYQKVKQDLLQEIRRMAPDSRLKSRPQLVKQYDVTRTTIDKAISELIGEGYLYAKNGSGTFVSSGRMQEPENMFPSASWGVIIPDIRKDVYPGMVRGIEDVANRYNINVLIGNTDYEMDKQDEYISKFIRSGIGGLIIVPTIHESGRITMFSEARAAGVPIVFCNRGVSGFEAPLVLSNDFYGAYIATKHAIGSGYQKIAFLARYWYSNSRARLQGYLSAMTEHGLIPEEIYYSYNGQNKIDVEKAAEELLAKPGRPDAIMCFNDNIAEIVYRAAERMGLSVGCDLGLIGYDNTAVCEQLPVKLTSVSFKTYEIGENAANLLLDITNGRQISEKKMVVLQPELVVRQSCSGRCRRSGEEPARLEEFI